METRKHVITLNNTPLSLLGPEIKKGDIAPNFTVLTKDLAPVNLSDYQRKVRIISVVPSIDTPVCDMQTRHFNADAAELNDVVVFSISADLPFALSKYCATAGINNVLTLSDHKTLDFGIKYGFAIEELRILSRGVVVIDKENVVRHIQYVKEITQHPDYSEALAVAKSASGD